MRRRRDEARGSVARPSPGRGARSSSLFVLGVRAAPRAAPSCAKARSEGGRRSGSASSLRSSDLSASAPSTGSDAPATARADSAVNPPRKTERRDEGAALGLAQQPPRLVEHEVDARVPRRAGGVHGLQQLGSLAQLPRDRLARQDAGPARRELQREREAVDEVADLDDRGRLRRGREAGIEAAGGLDEQPRRVECLEPVLVVRAPGRAAPRAEGATRGRRPGAPAR